MRAVVASTPTSLNKTPPPQGGCGALFTPANPVASFSPPSDVRRESLLVPPSANLLRLAKGSGVSVFRVDRSPVGGVLRSPWAIKKTDVSPVLMRERRRVERSLLHETTMLSAMQHPHIIGFRAAQRAPDGQLCLALELCDGSLYSLLHERQHLSTSETSHFAPAEIFAVARGVASGLSYLHDHHSLLHGDIKSANVLVSRALDTIKLCDLGASLALAQADGANGVRLICSPEREMYEGTEPWRAPETLENAPPPPPDLHSSGEMDAVMASPSEEAQFCACDRSDVWAFGLVIWEMLTGDVPHTALLRKGEAAYRAAIGTRPPLPPQPPDYGPAAQLFTECTRRAPAHRPAARQIHEWLHGGAAPADSPTPTPPPCGVGMPTF